MCSILPFNFMRKTDKFPPNNTRNLILFLVCFFRLGALQYTVQRRSPKRKILIQIPSLKGYFSDAFTYTFAFSEWKLAGGKKDKTNICKGGDDPPFFVKNKFPPDMPPATCQFANSTPKAVAKPSAVRTRASRSLRGRSRCR